jgi:hypothetical protein
MRTLITIWRWVRSLGQSRAVKQEIDAELRLHLEMRVSENLAAGMSAEEAARAARRRFGNLQTIREECRDIRGSSFGETMLQDVRFGLRMLRKNPGFTTVAVLTLALGIRLNTAIFSVVNGVLLKPLPYPDPDRLVRLWEHSPRRGLEKEKVSGPDFIDWREQNRVFENIAFWPGWLGATEFNLVNTDGVEKVKAVYASSSLFSVLGVKPLLGRTFLPEEDQREGNRVAVLSHGLWQRRFASDPNVIGQTLSVDSYAVGITRLLE